MELRDIILEMMVDLLMGLHSLLQCSNIKLISCKASNARRLATSTLEQELFKVGGDGLSLLHVASLWVQVSALYSLDLQSKGTIQLN